MDCIMITVKVNYDSLMLNCETPDELIGSCLYHYDSSVKPLKKNKDTTFCISIDVWHRACLMAENRGVDPIKMVEKCLSIYLRHHHGE